VDKFTGDGIMALFGAPIALEDHAVRACATALELHTQASALAAEVLRRDGVALALRVGLNSGEWLRAGLTALRRPIPRSACRSGWPSAWSQWPSPAV
jgi:class 3 adenylate cyclase